MENVSYDKLVTQLFTSAKWEKRAEAAREIGHLGEAKATNLLVRALKSEKDPIVINSIIEAFGRIKDPKSTMPIVDFLKKEIEAEEPDKTRLFVIMESLIKIGDKRALTHLGLLYNSCEEELKSVTEEALKCIDPNWKENIKNH